MLYINIHFRIRVIVSNPLLSIQKWRSIIDRIKWILRSRLHRLTFHVQASSGGSWDVQTNIDSSIIDLRRLGLSSRIIRWIRCLIESVSAILNGSFALPRFKGVFRFSRLNGTFMTWTWDRWFNSNISVDHLVLMAAICSSFLSNLEELVRR